jgi:hypothetical protein
MNNSSMTMRPSQFVERGNIDTLTRIHDREDKEKTNLISYVRRLEV